MCSGYRSTSLWSSSCRPLAVPFLILFKYGRPRGYLTDLVRSFFAPKAWCALERDSELTQAYVVDEEE